MSRLRASGRPAPRLLAGLAVAVLAVGCGAAPRTGTLPPEPTLGPSAVPSSDPAPSSAAPTPDPLMSDDGSEASIRAFMTAYYAAGNRAVHTGDVSRLRQFSLPTCGCRNFPDGIEKLYKQMKTVRGGDATLRSITVSDRAGVLARALVTQSEALQEVLDSSGSVIRTGPPVPQASTDYILNRRDGHWVIAAVEQVTS